MAEREKDPKKVAAGKARQAQRRAHLGDDGYRQAQRDLYHAALCQHPALSAIGGQACHAIQKEQLGVEGYRQLQAARYRKAVNRYGRDRMRERLKQAHIAGRAKRLANPTPGEAAVKAFWLRPAICSTRRHLTTCSGAMSRALMMLMCLPPMSKHALAAFMPMSSCWPAYRA